MLVSCKMVEKQSKAFQMFLWIFFSRLKQNFIAYRSDIVSTLPDCIFAIHQLSESGFSRVYFNCCCSCSFEPEIIRIGQTSHKMYSNKILNFQVSAPILNACTKKLGNAPRFIIIIMARRQLRSPWPSLVTPFYRLSLPAGLQGSMLYRHKAVVWLVLAGRPASVHGNGVHRSVSLMTS